MVNSIESKQEELVEDFELFEDWEGKYEYIIDLGKKLDSLPEIYKTEENIIKGCQSVVWLHAFMEDGKLFFLADSEAIIVKGLVSMLLHVYSGEKPEDIIRIEPYFIDKVGLSSHLAQTRSNGLASMVKQMRAYALAYSSKEIAK